MLSAATMLSSATLRTGLLAALLILPYSAGAHDFWIEPESFHPAPGVRVPLRFYVGQNFSGESIPHFPDRIVRFVSAGPAGEQRLPGVLGDDPAGTLVPAVPGLYVVGLHTKPEEVVFDSAAEFEQYLAAEGLERNIDLQRMRARDNRKIRETYFRCAKSLVATGRPASGDNDKALGLPLELIADTNPYLLGKRQKLTLRLLHKGQPLEGALVVLSGKSAPLSKLRERTGRDGRAHFLLPRRDVWLATAVHMVPAPIFASEDWNSLWASLTFELR
ncbi:MAG: DUF4198 domain-containing protein [Gammaproteobacteria bacterium]|nr:DUF4198 domain-containing protein [Gammaproteobacteria bacterium]